MFDSFLNMSIAQQNLFFAVVHLLVLHHFTIPVIVLGVSAWLLHPTDTLLECLTRSHFNATTLVLRSCFAIAHGWAWTIAVWAFSLNTQEAGMAQTIAVADYSLLAAVIVLSACLSPRLRSA